MSDEKYRKVLSRLRNALRILENNLREDGTVAIPEVLRMYMGGKDHIG